MKGRGLTCFALAFGASVLFDAKAAEVDNAGIDSLVKAEAPAIARQWNLEPLFRMVDGSVVEMNANGILEFGRGGLQTILRRVDAAQHRPIIRWIVAHETWHQVQRRDFGASRPEEQAIRRRLECEADIMASYSVVDTYYKEVGAAATMAGAKSLAGAMKSVIEELQRAEQSFGGASDHPSGPQRRNAINLGRLRGTLVHSSLIGESAERQALAAQLGQITDHKEDERIEDWASRTCSLVLHAGDGIDDLTELPRKVDFNKNGDPPIVDFQLPYRNTGKRTLSVVMQVATLAVPRNSPEDADSWQKIDALTYRFDLAPGQEYTLTGRLLWHATSEAYPRLLMPLARDALYDAIRGETLGDPSLDIGVTATLSPRLSRLAANLLMIANAASEQFRSIRGQPCRNIDGERICPLTVTIPSGKQAEITYEGNGASSVEIGLYRGKVITEAEKVFADFRRDLKAIYPFKSFRDRTTSSGSTVMSFTPTAAARFELRRMTLSNEVSIVTLDITPMAFAD